MQRSRMPAKMSAAGLEPARINAVDCIPKEQEIDLEATPLTTSVNTLSWWRVFWIN
jgi:hypothetical protein